VHGKNLRYENPPHKDTVGFWTKPEDWVEWEFDAPGPGTFEVEILQGCGKGSGGAKIEIAVAGQMLATVVEETGHFQRFVPRVVGTVKIEAAGKLTLSVKAVSKPGPAVMDLRRVTLRAL
jgi:arylsulfatase A